MSRQPILVLGATGSTGRRVAARVRDAGFPVRAASRRGTVRFDWADPATWEPATAGAAAMYLMAPHELPVDPAFVRCAVEQGVRRVVLLSSRAIEAMGDHRLMAAERTVRESGAGWTILRPDWFGQNFDEGFFRPAVMAGELAMPLGNLRQVFVDAGDIAAVAATALTEDGHEGRHYEPTGPRALSFPEALEIITRVSGRPVSYRGTPDDYLAAQAALGIPAEQTQQEIKAYAALRDLGDGHPTPDVRQVTGRDPKPFETYAAEAAAQGAWRDRAV
ncbi:NmrA family NAD(P)-binding protein [Sphaerisporangium sp. TRM90804]|uniref:NmrA family NAD(P)-binding protein n=1 Tax=Sphaerisporangium sp. TRM90804 TaxID=3031113 RepID=UPI00244D1A8C|nr:NmrA family NAD(P)-binding protein [Sphaerisporangium sp. TRM90804]MDH2425666.1 NmrA family NAD(P)-binding protein [Sphaerisporangium sp. TRM90804]